MIFVTLSLATLFYFLSTLYFRGLLCPLLQSEYNNLDKKLTQSELADLMGTTIVKVDRIERSIINPSIEMLSLISEALDTTMD